MRVYLIRHGETALGARFRFQSPDTPLSARGRSQVRNIAARIVAARADVFYSSPYRRARETAEILAGASGGSVEECDLFAEKYNSSDVLKKSYWSLPFLRLGAATAWNLFSADYRWSDVETLDDLAKRARRAREFLETHTHPVVVVVSHALLIAAVIEEIQHPTDSFPRTLPMRIMRFACIVIRALRMRNASVFMFDYDSLRKTWIRA